jgi:glycosyltransferase involved in cell wall biosynthesis
MFLRLNKKESGVSMKLAFIYSFEQSTWKSCQTITKNLKATYKLITPANQTKDFDLNDHTTSFELLQAAQDITAYLPDAIVILDHKPHPYKMLDIIHKVYIDKKIKKLPQIIIHVFGDFTLYSAEWLKIEKTLKNFSVKLVCASDSQTDLVRKFLKNKNMGLYKCPFPVDSKEFFFDQKARDKYRKTLNFKSNQTLYVYTGRLSLQKRVIDLIMDFATYLKVSNDDAYLFLAGEFDDLGNPFKGVYSKEGGFFQSYSKFYNSLDENIKNRIRYMGNLTSEELKSFYSAADVFVSLSVHNDEDYGMSPAEALCTGLPAILTAWAGYKSFKLKNNECILIPTAIGEVTISYNKPQFLKTLFLTKNNIIEIRNNRLKLQKINADYLSVAKNRLTIQKILEEKIPRFSGFSPLLKQLSVAFKGHPPFLETKIEYTYTDLYKKIYDSYISK